VPPGRNGIQPNLALTYNSYRGNGWIGVGWDLDMGAIQRSTKFGVDYNVNDFVVMDGFASELVPRPEWGDGYYGEKIESAFTKYYLNPQTGGWKATTKDGNTYFYGSTTGSRQDDPADSNRVYKWCLDKVVDPNGNYIAVSYEKDQGQIYLKQIDYTGNEGSSAWPPNISVIFHLEDGRPDMNKVYITLFEVVTAKRMKTVEVRSLDGLVHAYSLFYSQSDSSSRSLLTKVQQIAGDVIITPEGAVTGGSYLPDINFGYKYGYLSRSI